MYLRIGSAQDNHYAHPLDLLVYIDMNTGRILDTWMYPEPPAIPQMKSNYIAPLVQKEHGFRTGDISQLLCSSHSLRAQAASTYPM